MDDKPLFTPEELERFVGRSVRNPRVREFFRKMAEGEILAFNITSKKGTAVESEVTAISETALKMDAQVDMILGAIKLSGEVPVMLVMDGKNGMMLVGVGKHELGMKS